MTAFRFEGTLESQTQRRVEQGHRLLGDVLRHMFGLHSKSEAVESMQMCEQELL